MCAADERHHKWVSLSVVARVIVYLEQLVPTVVRLMSQQTQCYRMIDSTWRLLKCSSSYRSSLLYRGTTEQFCCRPPWWAECCGRNYVLEDKLAVLITPRRKSCCLYSSSSSDLTVLLGCVHVYLQNMFLEHQNVFIAQNSVAEVDYRPAHNPLRSPLEFIISQ